MFEDVQTGILCATGWSTLARGLLGRLPRDGLARKGRVVRIYGWFGKCFRGTLYFRIRRYVFRLISRPSIRTFNEQRWALCRLGSSISAGAAYFTSASRAKKKLAVTENTV